MLRGARSWVTLAILLVAAAVTALATSATAAPSTGGAAEEIIITGKVDIDMKMPASTRQGIRVVLNSGEFETLMRRDGSFRFPSGVGRGVYTLDVLSADLLFPQYKLDTRNPKRIRALRYPFPGAQKEPTKYPLYIEPLLLQQYFMPRQSFNVLSLLKNPMVLIVGFMAIMMIAMPQMMAGMDEEEMAKMRKQMREQQAGNDPNELLQSFFGGGSKDGEDSD